MSPFALLGIAWATAAVLQFGLWLVSQRTRNAAIVDVGWAGSFALVIVVWSIIAWPLAPMTVASGAGVVLWSVRLAGYLVSRGAASGPEEGRYRDLRQRWSPNTGRAFFIFFQGQAALTGLLCVAFVWSFASAPRPAAWAGVAQVVGLVLVAIGIVGESLADHQLAA